MSYREWMQKHAEGDAAQATPPPAEPAAPANNNGRKMSDAELGWSILGGGGGALAGWTLARLLHRKPSLGTKLLYSVLGAAGGVKGVQHYMKQPVAPGSDETIGENAAKNEKERTITENQPKTDPTPVQPSIGDKGFMNLGLWAAPAGIAGIVHGASRDPMKPSLFTLAGRHWINQAADAEMDLESLLNAAEANARRTGAPNKHRSLDSIGADARMHEFNARAPRVAYGANLVPTYKGYKMKYNGGHPTVIPKLRDSVAARTANGLATGTAYSAASLLANGLIRFTGNMLGDKPQPPIIRQVTLTDQNK